MNDEPLSSYQVFVVFFFLYNFALNPWETSNLRLLPKGQPFYLFSGQGICALVPWHGIDAMARLLHVSSHGLQSLVSHDMACPQVSPSLPRAPCPGFLPSQRTVAAEAVLWYLVTGSEGRGQLSGCNFSPR